MTAIKYQGTHIPIVRMESGADEVLQAKFEQEFAAYRCDHPSAGQEGQSESKGCLHPQLINDEFRRIFKDQLLDRVEAPYFYEIASDLAGDDGYLSVAEAQSMDMGLVEQALIEAASIQDQKQSKQEQGSARIENLERDSLFWSFMDPLGSVLTSTKPAIVKGPPTAASTASSADGVARPKLDSLADLVALSSAKQVALLARDDEEVGLIDDHLKRTFRLLTVDIKFIQARVDHLGDREASWFNNVTPENAWGYANMLTEDARNFTAHEYDAYQQVLARLERIKAGMKIFYNGWVEQGVLKLNHPLVKEFLISPYGRYSHIGSHFGHGAEVETKGVIKVNGILREDGTLDRQSDYSLGVMDMALRAGSISLAIDWTDLNIELFGTAYEKKLYDALPGLLTRCWHNWAKDVANDLFALDSVGLMALGAGLFKLATKAPKIAELIIRLIRHKWGPLIPGVTLFEVGAGANFIAKAGRATGNLLIEGLKFYGLHTLVSRNLGADAAEVTDRLCLFLAAGFATFEKSLYASIVDDVMSGRTRSQLLNGVLEAGLTDGGLAFLNRQAARVGRQRSFRLAQRIDPKEFARQLKLRVKSFGTDQQARGHVGRKFNELMELVRSNSGKISGPLVDEAKVLKKSADPQHAAARIDEVLRQVRRELSQLNRATSPRPSSPPPTTPPTPGKLKKGPRRPSNLLATGEQRTRPRVQSQRPQPTPSKPLSPLEEFAKNPPEALNPETISQLTGGRVTIERHAVNAITEFYKMNPAKRKAFWLRVSEIADDFFRGDWKELKRFGNGVVRGRIGEYRILVSKLADDQYTITRIILRSELPRNIKPK